MTVSWDCGAGDLAAEGVEPERFEIDIVNRALNSNLPVGQTSRFMLRMNQTATPTSVALESRAVLTSPR